MDSELFIASIERQRILLCCHDQDRKNNIILSLAIEFNITGTRCYKLTKKLDFIALS